MPLRRWPERRTRSLRVYRTAHPGTDDALTLRAQRAKKRSGDLLQQAKDIRDNRVPELERELAKKRYRLDAIVDDLANGKRNLNLINRALDTLPNDLSVILRGVEPKLRIILDGLDSIHRRIDDIDKRIALELMPKLDRLRAGTTSGLDNLTKIIEQARSDIRDASRLADRAEETADRVNRLHNQMELNLKGLEDRILLARHKSASIRVSLGTDRSGVCARTYEPQIKPSIFNNIIMNYAIKEEARDFSSSLEAPNGKAQSPLPPTRRHAHRMPDILRPPLQIFWSGSTRETRSHPRDVHRLQKFPKSQTGLRSAHWSPKA